jgi:hypothetical protein
MQLLVLGLHVGLELLNALLVGVLLLINTFSVGDGIDDLIVSTTGKEHLILQLEVINLLLLVRGSHLVNHWLLLVLLL